MALAAGKESVLEPREAVTFICAKSMESTKHFVLPVLASARPSGYLSRSLCPLQALCPRNSTLRLSHPLAQAFAPVDGHLRTRLPCVTRPHCWIASITPPWLPLPGPLRFPAVPVPPPPEAFPECCWPWWLPRLSVLLCPL